MGQPAAAAARVVDAMTPDTVNALLTDLQRDEGSGPKRGDRLFPYFDCCGKFFRDCDCAKQGKLTIGFGRNIEDIGISVDEARNALLENDVADVLGDLTASFGWFSRLDEVRQRAVANLRFNLGYDVFRTFATTMGHVAQGEYAEAGRAFRTNRRYFQQTKGRAERIAHMLETGQG